MKYQILSVLILALIFGACGPSKKQYKQYQGINYGQYEQNKTDVVEQANIDVIDIDGNDVIESVGDNYGEAVVVMATKKIHLAADATQKDVLTLQAALDSAYRAAMRQYRPTGFTYSMSPAGAVNPLSVMDVQCILAESGANSRGKETCDLFFREAAEQLTNLKTQD